MNGAGIRFLLTAPLCIALAGCAAPTGSANSREPALGLSKNESSQTQVVSTSIKSAAALAAFKTTREPWQFGSHDGQLITTPNYRLYTTIRYAHVLESLPAFYERALQHYTSALGPLPKPTMMLESYLFQSRDQWQHKTQEILPDQARMFSNLGRGGFTTRGVSVLYYIDGRMRPRDTFAIAAHEGWHQYTQRTFKHQLPIWLEEGIATYMEGHVLNEDGTVTFDVAANRERREALREASNYGRLISLNELLTRTPQSFLNQNKTSLLTYYAQVWALTRYLAEGEDGRYNSALKELLVDAAEGRMVGRVASSSNSNPGRRRGVLGSMTAGPAVLREYFSADLETFEEGFRAFTDEIVRSAPAMPRRGMQRPAS